MSNELFENNEVETQAPVIDPEKDYTEELVGPDKKYKTTADLARAVLHKDVFIEQLKAEKKEVLDDLTQKHSMAELIKQLEDLKKVPASPSKREDSPPHERQEDLDNLNRRPAESLTKAEVEALIQAHKQSDTERANLEDVVTTLKKQFGDSYSAKLREQSNILGMTEIEMLQMARTKPKAFLRLVGVQGSTPVDVPGAPRSSVNSDGFRPTVRSAKRYKDFQEMRRTNPKLYHSASVQQEMMKLATDLGPDFYN